MLKVAVGLSNHERRGTGYCETNQFHWLATIKIMLWREQERISTQIKNREKVGH